MAPCRPSAAAGLIDASDATLVGMAREVREHRVGPSEAGRIDRLVQRCTGLPRAAARRLLQHGHVSIDAVACYQDFARVAAGQTVRIDFDPQNVPGREIRPWKDAGFAIVDEDQHLIVVDKAAGVLTVPTGPGAPAGRTLEGRLNTYLRKTSRGREVFVVHRLDQDTSGLLVLAKSAAARDALKAQFEARKPERIYHALVAGIVGPDAGTFRSHLATAANLDVYSTSVRGRGELAITHYRVVRRFANAASGGPPYTWVQCQLETGRRNQIRVHFADAGHPVLGDRRYKPHLARHGSFRSRLALHAATLGFIHPATGQPRRYESDPPTAMQRLMLRDPDPAGRESTARRGR